MLNKKALSATAGAPAALYVEDVFSTYLYTGTGSSLTINNGIDLSGSGGMFWTKPRTSATFPNHMVYDTERGVTVSLSTNTTDANDTNSISSFNTNGYSLTGGLRTNQSGQNYVSFTFRKAEKFFDVVTYTGDGSFDRSLNHSLGSIPGCIIVKCTSTTSEWAVFTRSATDTYSLLYLNLTDAQAGTVTTSNINLTSTTFNVGKLNLYDNYNNCNVNGRTYVAYIFAHDAGGFGDSGSDSVIKCGSFNGNTTVNLGWEPQWILVKKSSAAEGWHIHDNMRGWPVSGDAKRLYANSSDAEDATAQVFPNSTGFSTSIGSGDFIYIAIRRGPMKTPESGTEVFEPFVDRTSIANKTNGTMGPVDMTMQTQVSSPLAGYNWSTFDRLRGANKYLQTDSDPAEGTATSVSFDVNGGVKNATWFSNGGVGYNFKRAPGFFDVVCYKGTGAGSRQVSHNLGVAPEMVIVKQRTSVGGNRIWWVLTTSTPYLNSLSDNTAANYYGSPGALFGDSSYSNYIAPTSSVVTLSPSDEVNSSSENYVMYLFATLAGVSKVGTYTGTASTLSINCGFTSGARLILIKRTDTTGNWYVWDSARGIVSGNDPYLFFDTTATEVTNTDYVDSISSGFELTADGSSTVNVTGGTYIFLAIA